MQRHDEHGIVRGQTSAMPYTTLLTLRNGTTGPDCTHYCQ